MQIVLNVCEHKTCLGEPSEARKKLVVGYLSTCETGLGGLVRLPLRDKFYPAYLSLSVVVHVVIIMISKASWCVSRYKVLDIIKTRNKCFLLL